MTDDCLIYFLENEINKHYVFLNVKSKFNLILSVRLAVN